MYTYFAFLQKTSGIYHYIYLSQILSWIFNILVFILLFDIYYVLFKSKLVSSKKKWIVCLLTNYLILAIVFLTIVLSYVFILENYVMKSTNGFEAKLNGLNLIYMLIVFFTGLIHISLASIRYLIIYTEETRCWRSVFNIGELINILWENKGSFILWIFMGYFITGAVGVTSELIGSMLRQLSSLSEAVSFPLIIAVNTVLMYIFYRYFVENYVLDILLFIKSKQY